MSILFADLVGFTGAVGVARPRGRRGDSAAVLRPAPDRAGVRGGTVEKFIGDAVMAVFGAPIAHEDDPERAVRAALAIRDWVREEEELEVRIAVNTGEVLVALEPSPGAERGLVAGDVVNTASRLQNAAPVNGILVEETTYNATSRVIEYRESLPVDAKGKAEPVQVWEAVEARSRFGTDITRRPSTPLVGRERELSLLVSTLARVEHESSPQLITLVGVPGIGKSRLVHELFVAVDERPELIFWRQGRCLPYGDGVAFWALGEILESQPASSRASPGTAEAKLRSAVEDVVPGKPQTRHGSPASSSRCSDSPTAPKRERQRRSAHRELRGVAALLRGSRGTGAPSSSSSRTSTGQTRACSTSSTTSLTGRRGSRSSSSPPHGPSS